MELFVLGLVFGVGAAKRKAVTKAVAKSYMAVTEKTRTVASAMREDMRDAVAEARSEEGLNAEGLDQASELADGEFNEELIALHEETTSPPAATGNSSTAAEPIAEAKTRGSLLKSLAKGYVAVTERTRNAAAGLREEMRDAVEEARYEREQAVLRAQQTALDPEAPAEAAVVEMVVAANVAAPAANAAVETVEAPKVKRKYTKRTTTAAVAPAAETKPASKAVAKATNGTSAPKKLGRPKAASKENRNAERLADRLVEVAEIAAEMAL